MASRFLAHLLPTGAKVLAGFTTCEHIDDPALPRVALDDAALGVHKLTKRTTHAVVAPPAPLPLPPVVTAVTVATVPAGESKDAEAPPPAAAAAEAPVEEKIEEKTETEKPTETSAAPAQSKAKDESAVSASAARVGVTVTLVRPVRRKRWVQIHACRNPERHLPAGSYICAHLQRRPRCMTPAHGHGGGCTPEVCAHIACTDTRCRHEGCSEDHCTHDGEDVEISDSESESESEDEEPQPAPEPTPSPAPEPEAPAETPAPTPVPVPVPQPQPLAPPSQAWEAVYPAGSANPTGTIPGGFGFYLSGPPAFAKVLEGATEAVFSYRVMLQDGWKWQKGGKLPGIFGGSGANSYGCTGGRKDECKCFDARLMWRTDASGELYIYLPFSAENEAALASVPPQTVVNPDYGISVGRGAFAWQRAVGHWAAVAVRVRLNDVGASNGEFELWIDGESVISAKGVSLRESAEGQIKGMHFQTFFGGHGAEWASPVDQRAWFADVTGAILQ